MSHVKCHLSLVKLVMAEKECNYRYATHFDKKSLNSFMQPTSYSKDIVHTNDFCLMPHFKENFLDIHHQIGLNWPAAV